jgi:uncharacterized membrane protein
MLQDAPPYSHLWDAACFLASCAIFLGYLRFMKVQSRKNPAYTVQGISAMARTAWVKRVMEEGRDVLAVQTLRNSTMGSTFLASTAILLSVGVLTLSGQGEKLKIAWDVINVFGSQHESLLPVKLIFLLLNLFGAFFFFASSFRIYNHVGYMINAPYAGREKVMSPKVVAAQLNRACHHYSMGMRGFYAMVPLVFWIFGPVFLFVATVIVVMILFHLDRTPSKMEEDFHRECNGATCEYGANEPKC